MSRESSGTSGSRLSGSFNTALVVNDGMTMSIWIRKADWVSTNQYGFVLSNTNGNTDLNNRVRIRQKSSANDRIGCGLWNSSGSATVNLDLDAPKTDEWNNNWILITYAITSATSRKCYINGGAVTASNTSTNSGTISDVGEIDINDPTAAFSLADGMPSGTLYAEACIWDKALSDAEVASLYIGNGIGRKPNSIASANVYGYWSLEDGDADALNNTGSDTAGDLTATSMASNTDHPVMVTGSSGGLFI
jgi:hypothetical protein